MAAIASKPLTAPINWKTNHVPAPVLCCMPKHVLSEGIRFGPQGVLPGKEHCWKEVPCDHLLKRKRAAKNWLSDHTFVTAMYWCDRLRTVSTQSLPQKSAPTLYKGTQPAQGPHPLLKFSEVIRQGPLLPPVPAQ